MKPPTWESDDGSIRLWHGDALSLVPELDEASIDGVITDPPYSSGGAYRGDRVMKTVKKYVNSDVQIERAEFSGDNRDQRSFLAWCSLWAAGCRQAAAPGAVLCSFIDWRQLPTLTDAVQAGGWVWRNLATWWKPAIRMQRGRFSSSAEFIVYATNGPHDSDGQSSPQNVFACPPLVGEAKEHIAEKPLPVAEWMMSVVRPRGVVLDPFMGSGVFGVAAIRSGRPFLGFEVDRTTFKKARKRLEDEWKGRPLLPEPVRQTSMFEGE